MKSHSAEACLSVGPCPVSIIIFNTTHAQGVEKQEVNDENYYGKGLGKEYEIHNAHSVDHCKEDHGPSQYPHLGYLFIFG